MKLTITILAFLVLCGVIPVFAADQAAFAIGKVTATPGTTVQVPITFAAIGAAVLSPLIDLKYDPSLLTNPAVTLGAAGTGNELSTNLAKKADVIRFSLYNYNGRPLSDGELFLVSFTVAPSAPAGTVSTLVFETNPVPAADLENNDITVPGLNGAVTVAGAKATPTITTWPTASVIASGRSLAFSTLSGGVSNPAGVFAFTNPATVPPVGTAAQSVTFTPNDTTNYTIVTGVVTVTVNPALTITTTSPLTNATVGIRFSKKIDATGGVTPYSWSLLSGSLPPGLTLNASTGSIAGSPTTSGAYTFTLAVTDGQVPPVSVSKEFRLTVAVGPLSIVTVSPVTGATSGSRFSKSFNAAGGAIPYSWSVSSGTVPPGLSLIASTGSLAGTPTSSGAYNFIIAVKDSQGTPATVTKAFTITVAVEPPSIVTVSLTNATVGVAYTKALSAIGGLKPLTWSVTVGTLPPGITLNGTLGKLTGTPTKAGTYPVTIQVADSQGRVASKAFTLIVK